MKHLKTSIYLDCNATAPLRGCAYAAMRDILMLPLNASAVHKFGQAGRTIIESARRDIGTLIGCLPAQIIFNSGATEGNNTVLNHFAEDRILVSAIEHPCVINAAPNAVHIPVTSNGVVDLNVLEDMLKEKPRTALVSVMLVNNETGVIQPITDVAALAHRYGALVHCDAVQAAGRIPIDMSAMGIDFLTLSSHKIGGPQGVGALALGVCGVTPVLLFGGGQEKYTRAGTENTAGIAGFGAAAIECAKDEFMDINTFESRLLNIAPNAIIHGKSAPRVGNTSLFSIPNLTSEAALMALDLDGIAVSNGSACSSGSVKSSHVLNAMGVPSEIAAGAIRVSTGWNTVGDDLEGLLKSFAKLYGRVGGA